jgi:acetyl esterase/lipase
MALDRAVLERTTVLPPPTGARVARDLVYRADGVRSLRLDIYRPARAGIFPAVFLVNGDAPEEIIATAKDWGVFRSYGEHLAACGMIGVPFNHRSGAGGENTAEQAADVRAAIAFVRERAAEYEVDPMRIGIWVFSAGGPFGLTPLLQRRPDWLRCAAGFYTIWDLEPYREQLRAPADERIRRWSAVTALDSDTPDMPPLLVARAGRDRPAILTGTDTFIRRCRERGVDLVVVDHLDGQHGFDTRDDDERSREIIRETLTFFAWHLDAGERG